MFSIVTDQALLFYSTKDLLSFDSTKTISNIKFPVAKSSGIFFVLFTHPFYFDDKQRHWKDHKKLNLIEMFSFQTNVKEKNDVFSLLYKI